MFFTKDKEAKDGLITIKVKLDSICCPITFNIFSNPVLTNCGHCFEEDAIKACQGEKCPLCNTPLRQPDDEEIIFTFASDQAMITKRVLQARPSLIAKQYSSDAELKATKPDSDASSASAEVPAAADALQTIDHPDEEVEITLPAEILYCQSSQHIFWDPVIVIPCGHCHEKNEVAIHKGCPSCKEASLLPSEADDSDPFVIRAQMRMDLVEAALKAQPDLVTQQYLPHALLVACLEKNERVDAVYRKIRLSDAKTLPDEKKLEHKSDASTGRKVLKDDDESVSPLYFLAYFYPKLLHDNHKLRGLITEQTLNRQITSNGFYQDKSPLDALSRSDIGRQILLLSDSEAKDAKRLCDKISAEGLNGAVTGKCSDEGTSPLLFIAAHIPTLLQDNRLRNLITEEGLNRQVIAEGSGQGISPLYNLAYTKEGRELLQLQDHEAKDAKRLYNRISAGGLNGAITSKGRDEGASPLLWITGYIPTLLQDNRLRNLITEEGLNRQVITEGVTQGVSPLFNLICSEEGEKLLQLPDNEDKNSKRLYDKISAGGLNGAVTAKGMDEGASPLLWIAGKIPSLLHDNRLRNLITEEGLNRQVIAEGVDQSMTPLFYLVSTEEGRELLQLPDHEAKDAKRLYDKISARGLNGAVTKGIDEGASPLLRIAAHIPTLLHDNRLRNLITEEGLNRQVIAEGPAQGMSPLLQLTLTTEGRKLLLLPDHKTGDAKRLCDKISAQGLNGAITAKRGDEGASPLLSIAYQIPTLLRDNRLRNLITEEGLNRQMIGEGPGQGMSPLYALASTKEGRELLSRPDSDAKDAKRLCDKISARGLNGPITDKGNSEGNSPLLIIAHQSPILLYDRRLRNLITEEGLNRPAVGKNGQNFSPLFALTCTSEGQSLLINDPELRAKITASGLHRRVRGKSRQNNSSPLWELLNTEPGRELLTTDSTLRQKIDLNVLEALEKEHSLSLDWLKALLPPHMSAATPALTTVIPREEKKEEKKDEKEKVADAPASNSTDMSKQGQKRPLGEDPTREEPKAKRQKTDHLQNGTTATAGNTAATLNAQEAKSEEKAVPGTSSGAGLGLGSGAETEAKSATGSGFFAHKRPREEDAAEENTRSKRQKTDHQETSPASSSPP